MRRSGDTLRDGEVLTADVVVVGAGPIGIVAALELADAGHRVLLAESGGGPTPSATRRRKTRTTSPSAWPCSAA